MSPILSLRQRKNSSTTQSLKTLKNWNLASITIVQLVAAVSSTFFSATQTTH
jgi:hypothetical protein